MRWEERHQLVGVVAAGAMLMVLFFLAGPLGLVPTAALAAVIMVSAVGLFGFAELGNLYEISRRELLLSVGTTLGVLILGVLPGVSCWPLRAPSATSGSSSTVTGR